METRTVIQYHVYGLVLNPMRDRIETLKLVALAGSKEALLSWHDTYRVESYYDKDSGVDDVYGNPRNWYKCFQKGSPLEWFNPIQYGGRIISEWLSAEDVRQITSDAPFIDDSYIP